MGLRSFSSLQKMLLAVIIFIMVGYVGYFVVRGRASEEVKTDASVSGDVCTRARSCDPSFNPSAGTLCYCPSPPAGLDGTNVWHEQGDDNDLDRLSLRRGGSGISTVIAYSANLDPSRCHFLGNKTQTGTICNVKIADGRTPNFFIEQGICSEYKSATYDDKGNIIQTRSATVVQENVTFYRGIGKVINAIPVVLDDNDFAVKCGGGNSGGVPSTGTDGTQGKPGCGESGGQYNQCFAGGSLAGQCTNDAMWEQGYYACLKPAEGGGGIQTFPPVKCTNLKVYVDPTTGKTGAKKCTKSTTGEARVCLETKQPVRGDATTGNGRCVEKKDAAGQVCQFGPQCAKEINEAPGLAQPYEVTGEAMRCEKRNNPDGGIKTNGICLPRFSGAVIGCGQQQPEERDAYCREMLTPYESITEGENGGDDYAKLLDAEKSYCHKVVIDQQERPNRFDCRLQRGIGKLCNPKAGNMCQDELTCTKVAGTNKHKCQ